MTRNSRLHPMVLTALMAAVLAVAAPFALPAPGLVPISLATLVIYFMVYILDWKRAAAAVLVYILLGAAGLPVFSGFAGGAARLAGPTGGYILGYIPLAIVSGLAVQRFPGSRLMQFLGMVLGTALLYAIGTFWYCRVMDSALAPALLACVVPFLPGDLLKMTVSVGLGPSVRKRLGKAGFALK